MAKRALLIGINYQGTSDVLQGCINDVSGMVPILTGVYGYSPGNILLLSDETAVKPTKSVILKACQWLFSNAPASSFAGDTFNSNGPSPPNTNFYFHYSGHGSYCTCQEPQKYDKRKDAICPLDYKTSGMIYDIELRSALADPVPPNSQLVSIMDCCYSGTNLDLLWTLVLDSNGQGSLAKVGDFNPTSGRTISLSGSSDFQESEDIGADAHHKAEGALTYAYMMVLQKNNYRIGCQDLLKQIRDFIESHNLSHQTPALNFGVQDNPGAPFSL